MNGVAVLTRRLRVLTLAIAAFLPAITSLPSALGAQVTTHDTTSRADSTSARKLERVMISAVRESAAPISQKTVTQKEIQQHYFGQDIPLVLQSTTPSLTSYAETGNYWVTVTYGSVELISLVSTLRSMAFHSTIRKTRCFTLRISRISRTVSNPFRSSEA